MPKAMPITPQRLQILSRASWRPSQVQVEGWVLQELAWSSSRRTACLALPPAAASVLFCWALPGRAKAWMALSWGHTLVLSSEGAPNLPWLTGKGQASRHIPTAELGIQRDKEDSPCLDTVLGTSCGTSSQLPFCASHCCPCGFMQRSPTAPDLRRPERLLPGLHQHASNTCRIPAGTRYPHSGSARS